MKKFLLFTFSVLIFYNVSSQGVYIGCRYAKNWTNYKNKTIEEDSNQDYKISFGDNYGITVSYYFMKNVGITGELLYSVSKQKYKGFNIKDYESIMESKSFDIPIILNIGKLLFVEAGGGFTYVADASFKQKYDSLSISKSILSDVKRASFFTILGIGSRINLTDNINVVMTIRYTNLQDNYKGVDAIGEAFKKYNTKFFSIGGNIALRVKI